MKTDLHLQQRLQQRQFKGCPKTAVTDGGRSEVPVTEALSRESEATWQGFGHMICRGAGPDGLSGLLLRTSLGPTQTRVSAPPHPSAGQY